jgi:hypothetical protein
MCTTFAVSYNFYERYNTDSKAIRFFALEFYVIIQDYFVGFLIFLGYYTETSVLRKLVLFPPSDRRAMKKLYLSIGFLGRVLTYSEPRNTFKSLNN